ncbi:MULTISPECIES: 2Fe-2S iron-sulfur cluster-binding protein [unclassified Undibacterium]|uniref:2Fe-2S iron-sulfur cluster-binding protein n=1 Tax=unclassified Undibacterium TaxID=2630295 RepID=UPI002AC9A619|nr:MULTISPECIES: 2Fe-2S iron-sulfur cluster-binding protein [unclassified Undibacterium]MEB0140649.1 2Fe-2S iron-sulfur cluster-binding protein [Undibacterium sp. CCC2.1]MEB0172413.1 2Fe-2S iron-sulfur cluster-binding protein [Undibacterium sp. CCC1.1]MEB0177697.1 2Fe-2S iron-sulfur cluster-binding protein [Undibacterium sp. CCC3.4]MEB0215535.1 2Fe-2S iron-sulfur cluster-binding protein [Undibacterium sp. 5I2]WPX43757.1 2Fe-2S iron-sulfur cluster-binding protein [Undibacterium sp. CCC3.4]
MTSLTLLLLITLAIVLQLTIYLSYNFWQHWRIFQVLRRQANESDLPIAYDAGLVSEQKKSLAWNGLRTFRVSSKTTEDELGLICSFFLVPEDGLALPPFYPGQFLTFQIDLLASAGDANGVSERIIRCYSLSDAPAADGYRISVKRALPPAHCQVPEGRGASYFHDQVEVGRRLQVRAPAGHFYIDRSMAPVVLIAGGIGITPMMSMLNCTLPQQPGREVWLFYGVRQQNELVMRAHLEHLAADYPQFHLRFCFSDTEAIADAADLGCQYRGRIDVTLLRRQLPLKPFHYYICGPTPMLESLVPALKEWGVPQNRIHFESFGPASIPRNNTAALAAEQSDTGIVVSFALADKQVPWQAGSATLLDFAEENGIAVNSGCRTGSCGSCQTTILAGEVAYLQSPDYDPEVGTCLLCVCRPKTSVSLEL